MALPHSEHAAALRWRAIVLQSLIVLHIGIVLLALAGGLLTFAGSGRPLGYVFGAALALSFFAGLPTALLIAVAAPVWVWRAHANLRDLGLAELAYSPLWATASWFVPLINLVVLPRAMRELWNRSAGEDQYQARAQVALIDSWWSSLIGGALLQSIFVATMLVASIPGVRVLTSQILIFIISALGVSLLIVSAILLFIIVQRITRNQQSLVRTTGVFD